MLCSGLAVWVGVWFAVIVEHGQGQSWVCDPGASGSGASSAPGCPRRSDVMLRTESPHYGKVPSPGSKDQGDGQGLYSTWSAAKAFHATRLDWVYSNNQSFVNDMRKQGLRAVSLAINANLPDPHNATSYKIGRILNVHGEPIGAPWMQQWKNPPKYGCINNPDYLTIVYNQTKSLLAIGADMIQHDDPATNGGAVAWSKGNPVESGCYCDHCMSKFTAVLENKLNTSMRADINFSSSWSYREYLLRENRSSRERGNVDAADERGLMASSGPDPVSSILRNMFVSFQQNSSERYITDLREYISAQRKGVPLSCNNGGRWTTPYNLCDMAIGELAKSAATPGGLALIFRDSVPAGRVQVMTMPKAAQISSGDIPLVRWSIAFAYAIGANMIVPWDIYLPTPNAERYFGSATDYADIYEFVRLNGQLFDNSVTFNDSSVQDQFVLEFTGAGGDGKRFRLPSDSEPSAGVCDSTKTSLGSCEYECDRDVACEAVFVSPSSCCMLYKPLQNISGTTVAGMSYVRVRSNHTAPAVSVSTSTASVFPRVSRSGINAFVHVVDYGYAFRSSTFNQTATVSIDDSKLKAGRCGSAGRNLLLLQPNMTSVPLTPRCSNNFTFVQIPLPKPWSIITISNQ